MSKDRKPFRGEQPDDDGAGWINRFLADEDELDGRMMWRLASWGAGSVAALVVAILATRSPAAINRDQVAAAELTRQSQQVQWVAKESQNKARELAAAVDVLNADRDRLYARVTVLEQGLDSVTGALSRQSAATAPTVTEPSQASPVPPTDADLIGPVRPSEIRTAEAKATETKTVEAKAEASTPLPKIAPVATIAPAAPATPAKPAEQKTESAAIADQPPPVITASLPPDPMVSDLPPAGVVRRTEFGVDLGAAKSIDGLRGIWRAAVKSSPQHLASLQPIIVVKERHDGFGMQLRLVAGPLSDAAEAAKVCASLLTENNRACETSIYEGQRLNLISEKTAAEKPPEKAAEEHPVQRPKRRSRLRNEPAVEKPRTTSSFSSFFGNK